MTDDQLPPAPVPAADEEILDFTVARRRVLFRIDEDVFEAAPALPTGFAVEIVAAAEQLSGQTNGAAVGSQARRLEAFITIFDRILKAGSRERFRQRMHDVDQPVDPEQLTSVLQGLLARYGLRPTQPSPGSSTPPVSPDDGISSTAAPPSPASISAGSPSTGS